MLNTIRIRTKTIIGLALMALFLAAIGVFTLYELNVIARPLDVSIPESVQTLANNARLDNTAQLIRYYDEVLTQSARNYAFTGDSKWKRRYEEEVPKLEAAIQSAIALGDENDKKLFVEIESANITLVAMEQRSIKLVDMGRIDTAVAMLEGNRYWDEKRIYNERLDEYVNRRGAKYNEALIASVQLLDTTAQETRKTIQRNSAIIAAVVVIWLLVAIFLELQILSWIIKPIRELRATALAIAGGNEKQRVAVHSRDEIGELGMAFNTMADKLQESKRNVEEKVENRTRKIEEINKYMVERELKMIELKSRLQKAEEAAKTPRS